MSEMRYDVLTDDHIIFNPGRAGKPKNMDEINFEELLKHILLCGHIIGDGGLKLEDCVVFNILKNSKKECPICPGKEEETPLPEIYAVLKNGERVERVLGNPYSQENVILKERVKNEGWLLRVIPNKKPILNLESQPRGVSEVLIETPEHDAEFHKLELDELDLIFEGVVQRYFDLKKDDLLKLFLFFRNTGYFAGQSQKHGHCQIVCLPIIPKDVNTRVRILREAYERDDKCIFCEMIKNEIKEGVRIVEKNDLFAGFCPYASHKAFEMFIAPIFHNCSFANNLVLPQARLNFCQILKRLIQRLQNLHGGGVPYHLLLFTAPTHYDHEHGSFHYFFKIRPVLTLDAGFEWITGMRINPVLPEDAAEQLRNVAIS